MNSPQLGAVPEISPWLRRIRIHQACKDLHRLGGTARVCLVHDPARFAQVNEQARAAVALNWTLILVRLGLGRAASAPSGKLVHISENSP